MINVDMKHKPDNRFFNEVRNASKRILLLDYDGTIAPFKINRMEARPYPWAPDLINGISKKSIVAIISGRQLDELIDLTKGISANLFGSHGWERLRKNGTKSETVVPRNALSGLNIAWRIAFNEGLQNRMEVKKASIALHFRGLASEDEIKLKQRMMLMWQIPANHFNLQLMEFSGGIEIRCNDINKGTIVKEILGDNRDAFVAFLGDDITDEDAFRELVGKGRGIILGDGNKPTYAAYRLETPEDVKVFLENWLDASETAP